MWVGFDHKRPLNLAGAEAALPIWTEFMKLATAGLPPEPFVPPPGVVLVRIDPASGQLATPECPKTIDEAFYQGAEPTTPCPLHPGHIEMQGPSGGPRDTNATARRHGHGAVLTLWSDPWQFAMEY